jgi:1-acyl-sn-glycerol-3-phosphate acyltransferase
MRIIGRKNLPESGAFVLVANHSSHLDAVALGSILPAAIRDRACPVAAQNTFFTGPVSSSFSAFCLNALPLSRAHCGMHALHMLRERLIDSEQVLILFPEGTRTRTGEMGRFRQGIGTLVSGTAIPVVPCWIDGAFTAWPPQRSMPGWGKISVTIGTPLCFTEVPNDHHGWAEVAARLEAAIRSLAAGSP